MLQSDTLFVGVAGEVRKVCAVLNAASMPEAAAHNALGGPQERSPHPPAPILQYTFAPASWSRTRHTTADRPASDQLLFCPSGRTSEWPLAKSCFSRRSRATLLM